MRIFLRTLSLIFAILFVWAAYVQYNDPDALLWYAVYGVAALASLLFFFNKLNYFIAATLCVGYLIGAFVIWPVKFEGVSIGEGDITNIERGRESLGLLVVAL
ncbi:MAG: transmembrane 220 family protein, partial [Bacteroidota bacterium]